MNKFFMMALFATLAPRGNTQAAASPLNHDTMIAGSIIAGCSTIAYLCYKLNYKYSLADALKHLAQYQNELNGLQIKVNNPPCNLFQEWTADSIQSLYQLRDHYTKLLQEADALPKAVLKQKQQWDGYADYHHAQALGIIHQAQQLEPMIKKIMHDLQEIIRPLEKQIEAEKRRISFEYYYKTTAAHYKELISHLENEDILKRKVAYEYRHATYPLLASAYTIEENSRELATRSCLVPQDNMYQPLTASLLQKLEQLVEVLVNMPEYKEQLMQKRLDTAAQEELAEKRRIAQAQLDAQMRIVRAEEARAQAERDKAFAAQIQANAAQSSAYAADRKARAEEERVRVERKRLQLEESRAVTTAPASTNIHIHNS